MNIDSLWYTVITVLAFPNVLLSVELVVFMAVVFILNSTKAHMVLVLIN